MPNKAPITIKVTREEAALMPYSEAEAFLFDALDSLSNGKLNEEEYNYVTSQIQKIAEEINDDEILNTLPEGYKHAAELMLDKIATLYSVFNNLGNAIFAEKEVVSTIFENAAKLIKQFKKEKKNASNYLLKKQTKQPTKSTTSLRLPTRNSTKQSIATIDQNIDQNIDHIKEKRMKDKIDNIENKLKILQQTLNKLNNKEGLIDNQNTTELKEPKELRESKQTTLLSGDLNMNRRTERTERTDEIAIKILARTNEIAELNIINDQLTNTEIKKQIETAIAALEEELFILRNNRYPAPASPSSDAEVSTKERSREQIEAEIAQKTAKAERLEAIFEEIAPEDEDPYPALEQSLEETKKEIKTLKDVDLRNAPLDKTRSDSPVSTGSIDGSLPSESSTMMDTDSDISVTNYDLLDLESIAAEEVEKALSDEVLETLAELGAVIVRNEDIDIDELKIKATRNVENMSRKDDIISQYKTKDVLVQEEFERMLADITRTRKTEGDKLIRKIEEDERARKTEEDKLMREIEENKRIREIENEIERRVAARVAEELYAKTFKARASKMKASTEETINKATTSAKQLLGEFLRQFAKIARQTTVLANSAKELKTKLLAAANKLKANLVNNIEVRFFRESDEAQRKADVDYTTRQLEGISAAEKVWKEAEKQRKKAEDEHKIKQLADMTAAKAAAKVAAKAAAKKALETAKKQHEKISGTIQKAINAVEEEYKACFDSGISAFTKESENKLKTLEGELKHLKEIQEKLKSTADNGTYTLPKEAKEACDKFNTELAKKAAEIAKEKKAVAAKAGATKTIGNAIEQYATRKREMKAAKEKTEMKEKAAKIAETKQKIVDLKKEIEADEISIDQLREDIISKRKHLDKSLLEGKHEKCDALKLEIDEMSIKINELDQTIAKKRITLRNFPIDCHKLLSLEEKKNKLLKKRQQLRKDARNTENKAGSSKIAQLKAQAFKLEAQVSAIDKEIERIEHPDRKEATRKPSPKINLSDSFNLQSRSKYKPKK